MFSRLDDPPKAAEKALSVQDRPLLSLQIRPRHHKSSRRFFVGTVLLDLIVERGRHSFCSTSSQYEWRASTRKQQRVAPNRAWLFRFLPPRPSSPCGDLLRSFHSKIR